MEPVGNWMVWTKRLTVSSSVTVLGFLFSRYSRNVELKHEWFFAMQSVDYVCNLDANERNKEKVSSSHFFLSWSFMLLSTKKNYTSKVFVQGTIAICANWNLKSSIHFFSHSSWTFSLLIFNFIIRLYTYIPP